MIKEAGYNHPLAELQWKNLPENRILDQTEIGAVISMQKSAVLTKAIIREIRQKTGKLVETQDVINIRAKNNTMGRQGRTAEQTLNFVLSDLRRIDMNAFAEVSCTSFPYSW